MISLVIAALFFSMFYFLNTLYFTMSLIITILTLCVQSVFLGIFSPIFSLIVVIIYVGAIIVFIGYICAISPNILFVSHVSPLFFFFSFSFLIFLSCSPSGLNTFSPLTDSLYSPSGAYLFTLLALVLFLVLLAVSSQFFSPQGPFRSVS